MESVSPHDHDRSDDDSFEDAPEPQSSVSLNNVPLTRVEKTDDAPSHGEVPGTEAYEMRKTDAVPDQLEVVPEGSRSRSSSIDQAKSDGTSSRKASIPKTVVEKVDPASRSHGEVPGTEAHEIRKADAEPDEVLQAPEAARAPLDGTPTSANFRSENEHSPLVARGIAQAHEEAGGGDDFDDFAEEGGDDDFGEFDEADERIEGESQFMTVQTAHVMHPKLLDFSDLHSPRAIAEACQPFTEEIFPSELYKSADNIPPVSNSFLNERSHSLWSQLVAPSTLQPPHWLRSRTRRLFLVSLGVPVNLDEILPASKQKKLILPSIDIEQERNTSSIDGTVANGSVAKLKQENSSSASINRSSSKSERKRKGPAPPPKIDVNDARLLCSTTHEALINLSNTELVAHTERLEALKTRASEALEYWLIQRDSANGDKEAFEEVIQNLVKHAQKIRT